MRWRLIWITHDRSGGWDLDRWNRSDIWQKITKTCHVSTGHCCSPLIIFFQLGRLQDSEESRFITATSRGSGEFRVKDDKNEWVLFHRWNFNSLLMCVFSSFHFISFYPISHPFVFFRSLAWLICFREMARQCWMWMSVVLAAVAKPRQSCQDRLTAGCTKQSPYGSVIRSHRHFKPARLQDGLFAVLTSSCSLRVHVLVFFDVNKNPCLAA